VGAGAGFGAGGDVVTWVFTSTVVEGARGGVVLTTGAGVGDGVTGSVEATMVSPTRKIPPKVPIMYLPICTATVLLGGYAVKLASCALKFSLQENCDRKRN
jgi:hypothetical protein